MRNVLIIKKDREITRVACKTINLNPTNLNNDLNILLSFDRLKSEVQTESKPSGRIKSILFFINITYTCDIYLRLILFTLEMQVFLVKAFSKNVSTIESWMIERGTKSRYILYRLSNSAQVSAYLK